MRLLTLCLLATAAFADGGAVVLSGHSLNTVVTVFATPAPLRAGPADFSVLVQDAKNSPVLNANVMLNFSSGADRLNVRATHVQAVNKLLYAATVDLPRAGRWHIQVHCVTGEESSQLEGSLNVGSHEASWLSYWPYFAAVPLAILLFAANQVLKQKRTALRARTR